MTWYEASMQSSIYLTLEERPVRCDDVLVRQGRDIRVAPLAQRVPHLWLQLGQRDAVSVTADCPDLPGLHGKDGGETAAGGDPAAGFGRACHLRVSCFWALQIVKCVLEQRRKRK